jgi:hypothetical protein
LAVVTVADQSFQIEYILVRFDDKNQRAQLALRASEVLPQLQEKEHQPLKDGWVNIVEGGSIGWLIRWLIDWLIDWLVINNFFQRDPSSTVIMGTRVCCLYDWRNTRRAIWIFLVLF